MKGFKLIIVSTVLVVLLALGFVAFNSAGGSTPEMNIAVGDICIGYCVENDN